MSQINLIYFDIHEKAKNEMFVDRLSPSPVHSLFVSRFGLGCSTLTWAPLSGLEGEFFELLCLVIVSYVGRRTFRFNIFNIFAHARSPEARRGLIIRRQNQH